MRSYGPNAKTDCVQCHKRNLGYALLFSLFLLPLFLAAAPAAEPAAPAPESVWKSLAGWEKELEAEQLELRDELIAAHMNYLAALKAALAEVETITAGDPRFGPAWARAEYLLETSFRLQDATGEHEAFLQATAGLKPDTPAAAAPVPLNAPVGDAGDLDGGLEYRDADGERLLPVRIDGDLVLVDAETAEPISPGFTVTASAAGGEAPAGGDSVPLIKARAAWLRALTLERRGRAAEAGTEAAGLGLIRDWVTLGPLDSDGESSLAFSQNPEEFYRSLQPGAEFPGKNGPVQWKPFSTVDPLGRLFPGALFRTPGPRTAFFLALVHSPRDGAAVLRFGSDSPIGAAVNHLAFRREQDGGNPEPDREALSVWLRKGWNAVAIRTAFASGMWGLAARLTAPDGSPFPAFVVKPDQANLAVFLKTAREAAARSALERFYQPEKAAGLGGVSLLLDWLAGNPDDPRANFYLASILVARRMMEGAERFDRELIFRRATELSGGDPFFTLMAARSVDSGIEGPDREENLRLVLLKTVADQGSAAALADIGRLYLDVMRQPRRADLYAELALSVNPMSLRAGVLDYDVAMVMGWKPLAGTLLERLVKLHPSASAARLRLGRAALAGRRPRVALAEFHAVLGVDAGNREALDGAVEAMGMLGLTSGAVDLLIGHVEHFPYDYGVRLKLAELYRVLGRDADAQKVLDAALAMAPDDPKALAMLADIRQASYAEGKAREAGEGAGRRRLRQELDLSPPARTPPNGWEYLYFQTEDRMAKNGSIDRSVSFALKVYSDRAARLLRHLGFWLERDFERGTVTRLELIRPNGARETFTPPVSTGADGSALKFFLPPLRSGTIVEAEVEIRRERIPFLDDYFGQIAPMTQQAPVRLSRYMFTAPKERRIFFKPTGGAPEAMVVESPDGQEVTRIWEMNDLPAFVSEPDSPGREEVTPCVQISSFADWDEFARWYWRLIGAQYHSPPELRLLAERIAGEDTIPLVKLDRAAEWVAANIGHREWEYGPYAFRPINARSILSRLSADGKDRTLFLCLLAREYGLEAWPVLARQRDRRFSPSGTGDLSLPLLDHFNHSLVMVETGYGGQIFLDASNPYRPPGVMPSQLSGSPGVVVMPEGAEKIIIPDVGSAACVWEESADLVVDEDGSGLWEEEVKGTGTAAEALRLRFKLPDTRTDAWSAFLAVQRGVPGAAWSDFREDPEAPASAFFKGRARIRDMAMVEGDRVLLDVPPLPGLSSQPGGDFAFPLSLDEMAAQGVREQDLELPHGFKISRRVRIRYPDDWRLANPCQPFSLAYGFGTLSLSCESGPGSLILQFDMEVPGHRLAAADYPAFREMAAQARRWLRPLLVWEKP